MTELSDVGPQVLEDLHQRMMIDSEWSVRSDRSFTWWGHLLGQRVSAEPVRDDSGVDIVRVHAETDVLSHVPDNTQTVQTVAALNSHASLSAFVWNREQGKIRLQCSAYFHADNVEWLKLTFFGAIALQAADAHIKADSLAAMLKAQLDETHHPTSGRRQERDDMLNVISGFFVPSGLGASAFTEEDFATALKMAPPPWVMANGGGSGLTAEFPFPGCRPPTALLTVGAEARHPQLGSGALMLLKLPISLSTEGAAMVANALNMSEAREWTRSHMLGGWCLDPDLHGITFVSFVPSAIRRIGLLETLVYSMAHRARWANEFLATHKETADKFEGRDARSYEKQVKSQAAAMDLFLDSVQKYSLRPGTTVRVDSGSNAGQAVVGRTVADMQQFYKGTALNAKGSAAEGRAILAKMLKENSLGIVPNGTRAEVVQYIEESGPEELRRVTRWGHLLQVRLLDGETPGIKVWIDDMDLTALK